MRRHLLQDMIDKYCPNGVNEYLISEIGTVSNGKSNAQDEVANGEFPLYVRSPKVLKTDYYTFDDESIIIPGEGGIGEIYHYVNGKYAIHQRCYRINFNNNPKVNCKYIFYCFKQYFKNYIHNITLIGTVKSIRKPMVEKFSVKLPPIEIQNKIVEILDMLYELSRELSRELSLRNEQFKAYNHFLLTTYNWYKFFEYDENSEKQIWEISVWDKKFKEVEKYKQEKTHRYKYLSAADAKELIDDSNEIKILATSPKKWYTSKNKVLDWYQNLEVVSIPWGGSAKIQYYNGEFVTTDNRLCYSKDQNVILTQYIYYFFLKNINYIQSIYRGGALQHPEMKKVLDMWIDIPPIEYQRLVVECLSTIEDSRADINIGLEKAIELENKRFNYYLNELLNFDKY
ncbi:restriction endonuclease subunit S [Mycoplasma hafezii]|uniref:restriction endonuclease subunit S n=1 Tax=Mycoplasma hafezii TaxID=525886 RepID=UPI003CF38FFD